MLGAFVEWLQDYVVHVGMIGVIEGALGILAFAGLLSALLGSAAIKAGAIVVAGLGVLGLFIVLVVNRTEWHRRTELDRRLIRHYCGALRERYNHAWSVVEWDELTVISANGDTTHTISCEAVVECELLDFFSFWNGPNWEGWPDRLRRKVKIKVRSLTVGQEGGTRSDMTWSWISRNRVEVVTHLREPAKRGDTIGMAAELHWPARCLPLVRGDCADDFVLCFPTTIRFARHTVVMPIGRDVYFESIGLDRANGDDYELTSKINNAGLCETMLEVRDIEGGRDVGMRLDLK
ncbi:hypothetical protein [Umezawaea sp. NPDC059074]|uniref:hypothetical protein n=1 Tax=Umezawaea sp. NPDC059074 TaxID=3346716 RepID=UPI003690A619